MKVGDDMTENNYRSVMPEVCANCEYLHESQPRYIVPLWYCDNVTGYKARQLIDDKHINRKTCNWFSARQLVDAK